MRLIALLMTAALLFAGCTEDKPKEPDPTTKPSPTATVPSMPADATEGTDEGAIAFVKHYIDVFNYASNTGDVKELQKLSDPGCESCEKYLTTIETAHAEGADVDGFGWTVDDVIAGDGSTFDLAIRSKKYRTKDAADSEWGVVLAAKYEFVVELSRRGSRWTISEFYLPGNAGA